MVVIDKRCWEPYLSEIAARRKNFDIRLNDFEVEEDDIIKFIKYDPVTKVESNQVCYRKVRYILSLDLDSAVKFGENKDQFWTKEEIAEHGLIILGF